MNYQQVLNAASDPFLAVELLDQAEDPSAALEALAIAGMTDEVFEYVVQIRKSMAIRDGDGDGFVDDGLDTERPAEKQPTARRPITRLDLWSHEKFGDNADKFVEWFGNSQVVDDKGLPVVVYHGTNREFEAFDSKRIGQNTGNEGHQGYGLYLSFERGEAETYGDKIIEAYVSMQNPFHLNADSAELLRANGVDWIDEKRDFSIDYDSLLGSMEKRDPVAADLLGLLKDRGDDAWDVFFEKHPGWKDHKGIDLNDVRDLFEMSQKVENDDYNVPLPYYARERLDQYGLDGVKINTAFHHSPTMHWITDLGNRAKEVTDVIKGLGHDGIIVGSEIVVFDPSQIKSVNNAGSFDRKNPNIYKSLTTITATQVLPDKTEKLKPGWIGEAIKEMLVDQRDGDGDGFINDGTESERPVRKKDPRDNPNFRDWFGDSKVVNPDGSPLVVYHGTSADFEAFDDAKTGANDLGLWGKGHYFASSPESANSYALRQGDGARLIPAYVSIQNPLVLKTGKDLVTRLPDGRDYKTLVGSNLDGSKIKQIAQAGGHDGVIQIKPDGSIGDVVAYKSSQVKSAIANDGRFDPSDDRIRKSVAGSAQLGLFDEIVDGDGDGLIYDGTPHERPASKKPHEMTKEEWKAHTDSIKPLPRDEFRIGDIRVIQNPDADDYQSLKEDGRARGERFAPGEASIRFTHDERGNRWIWLASQATHSMIEDQIAEEVGAPVNQNSEIPRHLTKIKEAMTQGLEIPKYVQDQYPNYSDFFRLSWAIKKFGNDGADNFIKWFGDSKVVNSNGYPMVVYHGTNQRSGAKIGELGFLEKQGLVAGWFDTDSGRAGGYAVSFDESYNEKQDGVVFPVYLSIQNPKMYSTEYSFDLSEEAVKQAKADGFDGYSDGKVFVAFYPSQVKSATSNSREFSREDKRINKAIARDGDGDGKIYDGTSREQLSDVSRFKPMAEHTFEKPIVGPSGASLISYKWAWRHAFYVDKRDGDVKERRESDWDEAMKSAESGRDVVHQFTIATKDGDIKVVSLEGAIREMGYSNSLESKGFKSLASSLKNRALKEMQLQILQRRESELVEAVDRVGRLPKPIIERTDSAIGSIPGWKMGDASVVDRSGDSVISEERKRVLESAWTENRLMAMGIRSYDLASIRTKISETIKAIKKLDTAVSEKGIRKSVVRDGDGDGKIYDGTAQEQLVTNINENLHEVLGEHIAGNIGQGVSPKAIERLTGGLDANTLISGDDQNMIMLYAGVLGDDDVGQSIWKDAYDPKDPSIAQKDMKLATFLIKLNAAINSVSKQAKLKDALEKVSGAKVVSFKNSSGGKLILHPAVRPDRESPWQLSTLGPDGTPYGHNHPPTFEEGVARALGASKEHYWNESGYSLDEVLKSLTRKSIGFALDIIDRDGDGLIYDGTEYERQASSKDDYRTLGIRSSAFKNWFGDWESGEGSKVVYLDGTPSENVELDSYSDVPLVMYHGTAKGGFSEFSPRHIDRSEELLYGPGFYFTDDQNIASEYMNKDSYAWHEMNHAEMDAYTADIGMMLPPNFKMVQYPREEGFGAYVDIVHKNDPTFPKFTVIRESNDKPGRWLVDGEMVLPPLLQANLPHIHDFIKSFLPTAEVKKVYLNIRNPLNIEGELPTKDALVVLDKVIESKDFSDYPGYASSPLDVQKFMDPKLLERMIKIRENVKKWSNGETTTGKSLYNELSAHGKDVAFWLLRKAGYDGITHIGGQVVGNKEHRVWIAFHPNQIKAVDNQGTFDSSGNIYKSLGLAEIIDRDGDGFIYDGTKWQRPALNFNLDNYLDLYPGYSKPFEQAIEQQQNEGTDFYFKSKEAFDDFAGNAGRPTYLGGLELFQRPPRNDWSSTAGIIDRGVPLFFGSKAIEHADFFNDLTAEMFIDQGEYERAMQIDPIERGVQSGLITFRSNDGLWWVRVPSMNDRTIDTLMAFAKLIPADDRGPVVIDVEPTGRWKSRRSIRTYFDVHGLLKLHNEIGKACPPQLRKSSTGTVTV